MRQVLGKYTLTDDLSQIDLDAVCEMLQTTYWASDRSREEIIDSFRAPASVPFGLLFQGKTIGCARLITDRISFSWLADVFVHPDHRGKGLGKFIVRTITEDPLWGKIRTVLGTRNAHGLYEQFGFVRKELMIRKKAP